MAIAEESADLIGSNREAVIEATLKRFAGWITPMPGDSTGETASPRWWTWVKSRFIVRSQPKLQARRYREPPKELADLSFEERWRVVMLDQGLRFSACLSEMIAIDGNAIAMIWHSRWQQENYDYRREHKERDGKVYALRGNWATERGLMKAGPAGYYDEVTSVGYEPNCRCYAQWLYNLGSLPGDMLTENGRAELKRVRAEIERMMKDTN
ncbi:MAG: hypothetical protein ACHQRJ_10865 [Alphaproteobacteria bacterium]